jgi:peptide/nickel transport system ATP-binding protein/oligopeptide transport system ATP-binding protein
MIFIVIEGQYYVNYVLTLIEVIFTCIFLYFAQSMVMTSLYDDRNQEEKRSNSLSVLISLLIALGIGLGLRYLIGILGYFLIGIRILDTLYFSLAIIATVFFPFYLIFLKKFNKENFYRNNNKLRKIFIIRSIFVIVVSWIVFLLFLSIDLLGIPLYDLLPADPQNPFYDVFLLGFEWATAVVILDALLSLIIIKFISSKKKPPKMVVKKAIILSAVIAFGIWSIQLIVVELYLSRYFGLDLYEQDIRILFAIVSIIYFACFYLSTRFMFLPKERRDKQKLMQDFIEREELEAGKVKEQEVILDVKDLTTRFYTEEGTVYAVEGISFKIYKGEVLGFVGETGCGKSVSALSILQLIQPPGKITHGTVKFLTEDLLKKSSKEILSYRGNKITMIFQDPINSLNPVFTVGKQISEVLYLHKEEELMIEASTQENKGLIDVVKERTLQILQDLNIPSPENVIDRYPHELSGGMRQRIQIAMAIACSPALLIADEPTTALDVTVQNQILKLMKDLQKNYNTSILFITHDLSVISKMCNRVAVMYCGSIVEYGAIKTIFKKTYHPYTKGLLAAVPSEGKKGELKAIPGMIPNPIYPPKGCKFHPRCEFCFEPCKSEIPKPIEIEPNYFVSCHLYDPVYKEQNRGS